MKTCMDWLHELQTKTGWSRYRISKELGLSNARVYQLFDNGGTLDDEAALKLSHHLDVDPALIFMAIHAERAKSEESRAVWAGLLEKISEGFRKLVSPANACGAMLPQV